MKQPGRGTRDTGHVGAAMLAGLLLAAPAANARAATPGRCARVAVAAHALPRGHVVTPDDTASAPLDSSGTRVPCPASRVPVVGSTTRRSLAAGEPLVAPAVAPPAVVRRGEAVSAVYDRDGVALSVRGTAMNDAPLGGRVLVRVDARRRLAAVADAPGRARIVTTPGAQSAATTTR